MKARIQTRSWRTPEIAQLRRDYPSSDLDALALEMGRSKGALQQKAAALGIYRDSPEWTTREDAILLRWYAQPGRPAGLLKLLKRSPDAIYCRAWKLGIGAARRTRNRIERAGGVAGFSAMPEGP